MTIRLRSEELDRLYPAHLCVGMDEVIQHVGPSLTRFLGDEIVGKNFFDVFKFEQPSRISAIKALKNFRRELFIQAKNNSRLHLRGSSIIRRDRVLMLMGHVAREESEDQLDLHFDDYGPSDETLDLILMREQNRSLLEDARKNALLLEEKRKAAEAASRTKSIFLATLSHEIRTPLNGVLGMADFLGTTELSSKQEDALRIIASSGKNLLSILNQVLDLSKVEAGKLELERREFDLKELVEDASNLFAMKAEEKGLYCRVSTDEGRFIGDEGRIRQILSNLVFNAIKFTQSGGVDVRVKCSPCDDADQTQLKFEVEDTGIGLEKSVSEHLFTPFYQGDASVTRRFGGTGLGLSISKHLTELMGGTMSVESQYETGSTFGFTIRLDKAVSEGKAENQRVINSEPTLYPDMRVLAAEDNKTNQIVLSTFLQRFGIIPTMVDNGQKAIDLWQSQKFDLILMDIRMPQMGGEEATRMIRSLEEAGIREHTPIIAVTANVMQEQRDQYRRLGMDDVLGKPIDIKMLEDLLWRVNAGSFMKIDVAKRA